MGAWNSAEQLTCAPCATDSLVEILGKFLLILSPFISADQMNTAIFCLIERFQVQKVSHRLKS